MPQAYPFLDYNSGEAFRRAIVDAVAERRLGELERSFAATSRPLAPLTAALAPASPDAHPNAPDLPSYDGKVLGAAVDAAFEQLALAISLAYGSAQDEEPGSASSGQDRLAFIGAQAARTWLTRAKQSLCASLAAFGELKRCRSAPDLLAWQTWVVREQLQLAHESVAALVALSATSSHRASHVLQPGSQASPAAE